MIRALPGDGAHMSELSPDVMFKLVNYGVLPFWALLVFVPHIKITDWIVHSVAAPLILGVLYAWLFATAMFTGAGFPEGASFSSLDGVMKVFTVKEALVAGWTHYLVFDLFVGAWEARDAQRVGLNHFLLVPCLVLTLLVGPIGLALYLLIRGLTGRAGWSLFEG
jgi:ABA4-like protein